MKCFYLNNCIFPFSKRNRNPCSVMLSSFYCTPLYFRLPTTHKYYRHEPSYEAKNLPAHHEIPLILWNSVTHHKMDILGSTLSQMNPVHILIAYLLGPPLTSLTFSPRLVSHQSSHEFCIQNTCMCFLKLSI